MSKDAVRIIVALISFTGLILAAFISGTFLLASKQQQAVSTPTVTNSFLTVTPTATPLQNPYSPYGGTLVLNDSLQNSTSNWEESYNSTDLGTCKFIAGAYYASQPQLAHFTSCIHAGTTFSNFVFEVRMRIIQGDCGGIIFDADDRGDFYYFRICQASGVYALDISNNNMFARPIPLSSSSAFKTGLGQVNTIAVVVQGGNFDLYVNNQKLRNPKDSASSHSASDSTYGQGYIGVLADNLDNPTEVAFNDAYVWKL